MSKFKIKWIDHGREPQCEPDPSYPNGRDIDAANGAKYTCSTKLPYPAKRCGVFIAECKRCGYGIVLTTAGRPDDPRSVTVACTRQFDA